MSDSNAKLELEICEQLAEGGQCLIFRAVDIESKKNYVIKAPKGKGNPKRESQTLKNEYELLCKMKEVQGVIGACSLQKTYF